MLVRWSISHGETRILCLSYNEFLRKSVVCQAAAAVGEDPNHYLNLHPIVMHESFTTSYRVFRKKQKSFFFLLASIVLIPSYVARILG